MNNRIVRTKSKLLTVYLPGGSQGFVAAYQKRYQLPTVSDVLRHVVMLSDFDNLRYEDFVPPPCQFSFRLPASAHVALRRCARKNHASLGAIIRVALVQALPADNHTTITTKPNKTHTAMSSKPVLKKPAAPAKKAVPATKPAAPAKKPAAPAKKPALAPAKKPALAPAKKPAPVPATKPAAAPAKKVAPAPAKKPVVAPAKKPAAPAKKQAPVAKPAPAKKPAAPVKKASGKK